MSSTFSGYVSGKQFPTVLIIEYTNKQLTSCLYIEYNRNDAYKCIYFVNKDHKKDYLYHFIGKVFSFFWGFDVASMTFVWLMN